MQSLKSFNRLFAYSQNILSRNLVRLCHESGESRIDGDRNCVQRLSGLKNTAFVLAMNMRGIGRADWERQHFRAIQLHTSLLIIRISGFWCP